MALTFETQEALVAYVREQLSIEMDREYEQYGDGYSRVRAVVTFLGREIGEETIGISPENCLRSHVDE